jgi:hypothetical protein
MMPAMFYTKRLLMLHWKTSCFWIFILLATTPAVFGAQKSYSTGKFVEVQQKTRDKLDMYLVNTPVTSPVPYFEISLEIGATDYVAEYSPRHSAEELPEAWRAGENVEARVDKRHLFLKRPDGTEMQWLITKRTPVRTEKKPQ